MDISEPCLQVDVVCIISFWDTYLKLHHLAQIKLSQNRRNEWSKPTIVKMIEYI